MPTYATMRGAAHIRSADIRNHLVTQLTPILKARCPKAVADDIRAGRFRLGISGERAERIALAWLKKQPPLARRDRVVTIESQRHGQPDPACRVYDTSVTGARFNDHGHDVLSGRTLDQLERLRDAPVEDQVEVWQRHNQEWKK